MLAILIQLSCINRPVALPILVALYRDKKIELHRADHQQPDSIKLHVRSIGPPLSLPRVRLLTLRPTVPNLTLRFSGCQW